VLLGLAPGYAAVAGTSSALAATGVSVQTVYENTPISVNMSDAVGYEFTNTTGQTETVSFTDDLPQGVSVDNPAALTNTPGTGVCVVTGDTANPGAGDVAVTVQVPSSSGVGVVCTVSVDIVPSAPSDADAPLSDTYTAVKATPAAASVAATPGGLIVLSDPTLSLTAPVNGQVFTLGQVFDASFSCAASDPLDSVDSFFGTDDMGNQIASGEPIDTVDPGSRTLEIECYSAAGGGYTSQTVGYSVGSYTLTKVSTTTKTGQLSFRTVLPAGSLTAEVLDGKTVIGKTTTTVTAAATVTGSESVLTKVTPTKAGLKALKATTGKSVGLTLETSFTPAPIGTGDAEITPTSAIKLTRANVKLSLAVINKRKRK